MYIFFETRVPLLLQEEVRLRTRTLQYTVTGTDGLPLVVYWVFLGMKKMLSELDPSPPDKTRWILAFIPDAWECKDSKYRDLPGSILFLYAYCIVLRVGGLNDKLFFVIVEALEGGSHYPISP